jgi:hypothetical protein
LKQIACSLEQLSGDQVSRETPAPSNMVIQVNGKCGNSNAHLAQLEPFLQDWSETYESSNSTDSPDEAMTLMDANPNFTAGVPSSWKPWAQCGPFVNGTVQNNVTSWLPQSPLFNPWSFAHPDTLGSQLALQPIKAFIPKGIRCSLISKYMMNTIRRYPAMMLGGSSAPPFIHGVCLVNKAKHTHMSGPGPLLRCAGLVELWTSKTANNSQYLWRMMRWEQQRICDEVDQYEDMIAVNALQAITIYFLLRVGSLDDEDADFDVPLIQTMTKIAQRVQGITSNYRNPALPTFISHDDWVIVESLQRTIAALFIIEFLFDITPGMGSNRCDSGKLWSEMLLPSAKPLWEAKTREGFEREYRALGGDERPFYGELLRHSELRGARAQLLDRWMTQVDEFGTLVINVASVAETVP